MNFRIFLSSCLLCFFCTVCNGIQKCYPTVEFIRCFPTKNQSNPYWNFDRRRQLSVALNIKKSCPKSIVHIRWLLEKKETRRIFRDMRKYNNKQIVLMDPYSLPTGEYIILARARESAFGFEAGTVEKQCWIRATKHLPRLELIAPRINGSFTTEYSLPVETNTIATGWVHCSNPAMFIQTSPGSKPPVNIFFGEVSTFDDWVNKRTRWIVGKPWRWTSSKSWTVSSKFTSSGGKTFSRSSLLSKSSRFSSQMKNSTGYVGYPAILNDSFPKRTFFQRKGFEVDVITGLQFNKKYRFLLCEHGDIYTLGCRNLTEITTCPNYAMWVSCTPEGSEKDTHNSYSDVIGMRCKIKGNLPKHLSIGLYSIGGKAQYAKGPSDIMIGHFADYRNVYFRLYASPAHVVQVKPVDYETHVQFNCTRQRCKKSYATFQITSDVRESIELSTPGKFSKLIEARDGKLPCKNCTSQLALTDISFAGLVSVGKIGDAVQLGLSLLKDLEMLDVKISEKNDFQLVMLDALAKITDWTWPHLELMVGFLPYFDMEGSSKEIGHSKAKCALLKNIMTSMKKLIIADKFPLTVQVNMETIFFDSFYRQISHMFDEDYVKPFSFVGPVIESPPFHAGRQEEYEDYGEKMDEAIVDDYIMLMEDALQALSALLFARSKTHHYKEEHLSARENSITSKMFLEFQNTDHLEGNVTDAINIKIGSPVDATEKEFRFIWTLASRDAFFWHNESHRFETQYVFFTFYSGDEEQKSKFDVKPIVELQTSSVTIPIRPDGILVPCNPNEWTSEIMDRFIRVYRFQVDEYKGFTMVIFISEISPVDRLMAVVDQSGNIPRLGDFSDPKSEPYVFDKQNTAIFLGVETKGYWYIALLPYREDVSKLKERSTVKTRMEDIVVTPFTQKKRVETVGINFVYSLVMYSCPIYLNGSFKYDVCTVLDTSSVSRLDCECDEVGGPLSASIAPIPHKIYGILDVPDKLELTVEYVIIAFTLVALFLYCFFLVLAPYRSKPAELIYFLADNAKQSRYGYLIRVTTADFPYAGTTAYVGIQLYGSNSDSKRHILNYPDPAHKLLGTGSVDHFLLATNDSLGNINRMEIWSNCAGFRPNWYCESVRVYDVQRYISWYFNVQKEFSAERGSYSHYFVKPTHPSELTVRTPWNYFTYHFGANHSWNIYDTSHDQYWSYMERMTILLTHVLATFALALYFIHPPKFEYQDGIGVEYHTFAWYAKTIAIVTCIVAPVLYLLAAFLKGSIKSGRFRGKYGYFPPYYAYFTWIALLIINILCLVYCLVYGPFISSAIVYVWAKVVVVSLLINIFFCENLFLAIHALIRLSFYYLNAWVPSIGTNYSYRAIIEDVETQRKYLYNHMDRRGVRPYIRPLYKPLGGDLLRQRQEESANRLSIKYTIRNMIIVWVMIIFLMILIPFYVNNRAASMNDHLEDIFVHGNFSTEPRGIHDVYTHDELYEYLNNTLVYAITPQSWYRPYSVADSGMISDITNKVIGNVRIRQQRSNTRECPKEDFAGTLDFEKCIPPLKDANIIKNSSFNNNLKHNMSMWWFHTEEYWNNYKGMLKTYNGDGHAINIGKTRSNAYYRVQLLMDNQWLDERTKFIIIEMLVYNANVNLFADIKLVWEREAKYMNPSHDIKVATLLKIGDANHNFYLLVFVLYAVFSVAMLMFVIEDLFRKRCHILKSWQDIGLVLFSAFNIYSVVLFFYMNHYTNKMLRGLIHADRTKFFPYSHVIFYHRELVICWAVMVFIILLMLLQFMQFFAWTRSVIRALRKATPLFLNLMFCIVVCLTCFGLIAHIFFENVLKEFNSFLSGFVLFLLMFTRAGNSESTTDLWRKMRESAGNVIIWFYTFMGLMVLFTKALFFIACAMSLHLSKKKLSAIKYKYTLTMYFAEHLGNFWGRLKAKCKGKKARPSSPPRRYRRYPQRGGQDEGRFVTPALDRYRYRNVVHMSEWKMKKQEQITVGYLRNYYIRPTNSAPTNLDLELMRGISEVIVGPREYQEDLYYEQRKPFLPRTETILVPDQKMRKIAWVAEQLLESRTRYKDEMDEDEDLEVVDEKPKPDAKKTKEEPRNFTVEEMRSMGKSQTKQLQGMLVILDISNDVIDTVGQKLLGPLSFAHLPNVECCEDD